MTLITIRNDNDYHYHYVALTATKKCVGGFIFYVYVQLYRKYMAEEKTSILLADVAIEGDLVEKDKIILVA